MMARTPITAQRVASPAGAGSGTLAAAKAKAAEAAERASLAAAEAAPRPERRAVCREAMDERGGVAVCHIDLAPGRYMDVGRMVEGSERAAAGAEAAQALARCREDDDLVHVAVDGPEPAVRAGMQVMRIDDRIPAEAADVLALRRKLDDARIVRVHQRVMPQHHEHVPARIGGHVRDEAGIRRPGPERALDAISRVAQRDDEFCHLLSPR